MDDVAEVTRIADAAEAADGASPLDEAARIALADGAATVAVEGDGFALVHDGDLSLAVHPDARGHGVGAALLQRVASYDGELVAWSHGNHPAAARLAAAYGWERVRDLWVMRRDASLPLPPRRAPGRCDDPVLRRLRRGRGRGGQRGRLRAATPSRARWIATTSRGGWPSRGSTRPACWSRRTSPACSASTGPSSTTPSTARCTSSASSPQAQGRGLGRLLTLAGLHHLAGLGVGEVLLYVEADNAPGRGRLLAPRVRARGRGHPRPVPPPLHLTPVSGRADGYQVAQSEGQRRADVQADLGVDDDLLRGGHVVHAERLRRPARCA